MPRSILYDNTKLAVARILGDGVRQWTRVFSEPQSHYVFADRFGRPGKGNDKGKVEGLIGCIRRNLLVPVPRATSLDAPNAWRARRLTWMLAGSRTRQSIPTLASGRATARGLSLSGLGSGCGVRRQIGERAP